MTPELNRIYLGDALSVLKTFPDEFFNTIVTSPPYWGLRDYGEDGQLGLEKTPEEYVGNIVALFREARRVLKKDGTLWLNLGDSYSGSTGKSGGPGLNTKQKESGATDKSMRPSNVPGLKHKDIVGIPRRVSFALQSDGRILRSDIIWHKPNPMPESVTDRPTKSHEYIFLLAKSERYYYDADSIREPHIHADDPRNDGQRRTYADDSKHNQVDPDRQRTKTDCVSFHPLGRNKRTVWTINTKPFSGSHFATFPPELIFPCVVAGSERGGVVLDPFMGAGTAGIVARATGRNFVGVELNPEYLNMAERRIASEYPKYAAIWRPRLDKARK